MIEDKISYLELCKELQKHNYLYYILNESIIDDNVYDKLFCLVKEAEANNPSWITPNSPTQTVGHPVYSEHFSSVRRDTPMLSLDNVFTVDNLIDWTIATHGEIDENVEFVPEWKMDGLSLELVYKKGYLVIASTRGDGLVGEDVTPNALMIKGIPKTIGADNAVIRGEVVVKLSDYHEINEVLTSANKKTFANPRNYAAGSLRQKDPLITKERKLKFVAYSVDFPSTEIKTEDWYQDQNWLREEGFLTADTALRFSHDSLRMTAGVPDVLTKLTEMRPDHDYEVDGVVVKVVKHKYREHLGGTSRFPKWAIAYKFPASEGVSILREVINQIGRTGKITPVAKIDPVNVHGTTISNVTLHNYDEIERLGLYIGAKILVKRAGDVIPKITQVIDNDPEHTRNVYSPQQCPCCYGRVRLIKNPKSGCQELFCFNEKCPDRVINHLYYCADRGVFNIQGLGIEIIRNLYGMGIRSPLQLFWLTESQLKEACGSSKVAAKLLLEVKQARTVPLERLIMAMGIDGVAKGTSERLCQVYSSLDELSKATVEDLVKIKDIGETTAKSIVDYFNKPDLDYTTLIKDLNIALPKIIKGDLIGKSFVVTGSKFGTSTRKEVEAFLKGKGAIIAKGVTSNTMAIYCGTKYTEHKLEKAIELNIPFQVWSDDGDFKISEGLTPLVLTDV